MAVSKEVLFLSIEDSSLVKPTKTGTVPKGLMIENKEAKAKKIADIEAKKKLISDRRKAQLEIRNEARKVLREKNAARKKKKEQEKKDTNN